MHYEKDMRIDEESLELEWLDQANLAFKYGSHWAECKRQLALAEENIKLVRSELINEVNENPDSCLGAGIKPTAPVVEAYYRNHERHIRAKQTWIDLQFETDIAEVAKWEISNTRKAALENLVRLHGQQYFAGPSVPRDITWERKQKGERANNTVANSMKRKSKD